MLAHTTGVLYKQVREALIIHLWLYNASDNSIKCDETQRGLS